MKDDGVVTHQDVLDGLSPDVRRALVRALPPPLRGWLTEDEVQDYAGLCVEVISLGEMERRYFPMRLDWQKRWPAP